MSPDDNKSKVTLFSPRNLGTNLGTNLDEYLGQLLVCSQQISLNIFIGCFNDFWFLPLLGNITKWYKKL